MDKKIFIGIGSNMGQSRENCIIAIKKISSDQRARLRSTSSFYRTSPVSDIEQNDFINCAIEIDWNGTPRELLQFLNEIESSMGRTRDVKNGPRAIDLDILLYGARIVNEDGLMIPHKELHRRKFAIVPCLEIDPDLVLTKPLASFLPEISKDQKLTKLKNRKRPFNVQRKTP
jgi:2-amino-4-hydroxy-6-hydroxymethyldihydropteridine diphosphokinase